jgi:hypothetical protein
MLPCILINGVHDLNVPKKNDIYEGERLLRVVFGR